ncbi:MAG: 2-amino-4-hydroxy-6-hydroxymethyldihydropteridine diphosphokinase [Actinobacteria bacterium]|nr:2-amino-4-hydroxy-6-hydroxymethyldihydropteridine diphosphokinase [Actinomycetota bacterium]MCL6104936.1 2-amino-4-hydroxy-6-hydroxymethyldihydropteridine diphosphokinase [Actinomycetota bacterium]
MKKPGPLGANNGSARTFIGLGSNISPRLGYLKQAVIKMSHFDALRLSAVSSIYETSPVGGPKDQAFYLNMVVELYTALSARQLLAFTQQLEADANRTRLVRWGPRTLDVDILLVGDLKVNEPDLEVPHPLMYKRRFVLAPLRELAPELVDTCCYNKAVGKVKKVAVMDLQKFWK